MFQTTNQIIYIYYIYIQLYTHIIYIYYTYKYSNINDFLSEVCRMDKACENRSHVFFCTGQNQKVSWWVNVASTAPIFQHQTQTWEIFGIPWIPVVTFSRSIHQSLPSLFLAAYGVSLGNVQQMASFTHLHFKETLVNYYIYTYIYIVGILHGI